MKPLLVPGGRAFVWPSIQQVQRYVLIFNITNIQADHHFQISQLESL